MNHTHAARSQSELSLKPRSCCVFSRPKSIPLAKHDWLVASCRFPAFQRLVRGGALLRGQCGDAAACLVSGTSRAAVRGAVSPKSGSAWRQLLSGAAAGAASRTATAPLETVRLQAMTGALPAGQPLRSARSVAAASGWKSLCAPLPPFLPLSASHQCKGAHALCLL